MLWRIGDLLDLYAQIEWVRAHEFEALSFWTMAGKAGVWQGFDVLNATPAQVSRLRAAVDGLEVDLHSGFDDSRMSLCSVDEDLTAATVEELIPTLDFDFERLRQLSRLGKEGQGWGAYRLKHRFPPGISRKLEITTNT